MKYAIIKRGTDAIRDEISRELIFELANHGCTESTMSDDIKFILNLTTFEAAVPVHRREKNEFVVSMATLNYKPADLRFLCYNTLIQTLANLVICIIPKEKDISEIYCITPEVGFYHFPYNAKDLLENIWPIIGSHFMIDNTITNNLPDKYKDTGVTEQLKHFGKELDLLGVLPTPFKLETVLDPENVKHVYELFNIRGLSYGNLSMREDVPEVGENTFWMTARGVDKANLKGVGEDIMLVTGYDLDNQKVLVSLPAEHNPLIRVSVDAIEHALIYEAFPSVGAIVHVHAWYKDDIPATRQNYPCGTIELAREVVDRFRLTNYPERAVIGLKNHGLTITGNNLQEIFDRIEGKLLKEVPMMA
jgi:ribulose-5-phosphate 4-epimerase/fuculose-1-phosphate aldolase